MRFIYLIPVLFAGSLLAGERTTISLDGDWDIADSVAGGEIPSSYTHRVPVPGLAHSAQPPFPDVDEFESRQYLQNRSKRTGSAEPVPPAGFGISRQSRNWFWYRRNFQLTQLRSIAILRINKAQFSAAVWINGQAIGEHVPCFSAAVFDVTRAIHAGSNEIIVRIGAHPGVLPLFADPGTDFEKSRWTPGIYDSVSLQLSDNPVIETVQVAPRIARMTIDVQITLRNYSLRPVTFRLSHLVHPWKSVAAVGTARPLKLTLAPGEEHVVTQSIAIPGAKLWWPEAPNLYVLESNTEGDTTSTRFGMREFRFDTPTKRAYLNNRIYFMRGSNITLHRFFEDRNSGQLPWNEQWVRRLLIDIPKELHWNSFRFCIGPVPERWLDIADEAGLLIQNEYFLWTGRDWFGPGSQMHFGADQMIREYSEWVRDNWNHPSVVIWDATNETWDPIFSDAVIPTVRNLDLSMRPWENSYNPPEAPNDPVEDHPYEFMNMANGGAEFSMTTFEKPNGKAPGAPTSHALILNEYGWTWLNRDGSPTLLTKDLYPKLLGKESTAEERLKLNAYLLAGITEFWRAYRQYAAVLHFVYLTSSSPTAYTSDNFRNIETLELDPSFRDYMSNAFAPLGVYLNFWQPNLEPGIKSFEVMLINDEPEASTGTLRLSLMTSSGTEVAHADRPFTVAGLGQTTIYIDFAVPDLPNTYLLQAKAEPARAKVMPTLSRRKVAVVAPRSEQLQHNQPKF